MVTKVYKLYATTAASNSASLIIQRRGAITAIKWAGVLDSTTDNGDIQAELSFTPVGQQATNDTVGPIDMIRLHNNIGAAGVSQFGINSVTNGIAIPVNAGDRLYLNLGGSATQSINCFVYVAE